MSPTFQSKERDRSMLAVEDAQRRLLDEVVALDEEIVSIHDVLGRVLREPIVAPFDVPSDDNSGMDGYAVRAGDIAEASRETPAVLRVIGEVPAGKPATAPVDRGTAMRIMTGAVVPDGADTVVQVELTDGGSSEVRIFKALARGANVRRRGEDMARGSVVLEPGVEIRSGEIGVLATAQRANVRVSRRPVVAVFSTGDEVVGIDQPVERGNVVNSNSYSLSALVTESGGVPRMLGIARDDRRATVEMIERAVESDFVISSGGVSVGAYDFVKDALDELGGETKFWQVAMKPGKPVVYSRVRDRMYFGLPGNPVSCIVAFHLFVAPVLRKAMGMTNGILPPVVSMPLDGALRSKGDRRTYFRVRVVARDGALVALPMRAQGSGVSTSMLAANGLAIAEQGVTEIASGAVVQVVLIWAIE